MTQRLIHDCAWATARHIVEVFAPLLREEEQVEAFTEVFVRIKAGMECLCLQQDRSRDRLRPGTGKN